MDYKDENGDGYWERRAHRDAVLYGITPTDRKFIELRRQPRWIERMNAGKLPNKDLTGKGPDAA